MGKKGDLDYLEDERRKLWERVIQNEEILHSLQNDLKERHSEIHQLRADLEAKTPDHVKAAKSSAASAQHYRNRTMTLCSEAEDTLAKFLPFEERIIKTEERLITIENLFNAAIENQKNLDSIVGKINESHTNLSTKLETIEEEFDVTEEIIADIKAKSDKSIVSLNSAEEINSKINTLHTAAAKRNREIKNIHDEIFGYSSEDTDGNLIETKGLKDTLESTYERLKRELESYEKDFNKLKIENSDQFDQFSSEKNIDFENLKKQIKSLMPDAMTAGLSHAYEVKRKSEDTEQQLAAKTYKYTIWGLLGISSIPVSVSLYSFFQEQKTLDQIIQNIPQISLAILPLYAPIFWFAISASKRIKLARRLKEEYAHKEVLSKTFEGLSTQISALPDSEISRELRARLLFNIINVSSENPGKLISDYNSSDNPLMEVIDKSLSLTQSLEKIAVIPGVQKILKKVELKRDREISRIEESITQNIKSSPDMAEN